VTLAIDPPTLSLVWEAANGRLNFFGPQCVDSESRVDTDRLDKKQNHLLCYFVKRNFSLSAGPVGKGAGAV
jgi:hypothetical protein